jgi:serine/threonine-protein kinase
MELDATRTNTNVQCPSCSESFAPPAPKVEPGVTLGNFLIEKRLGGGAMGNVFLALQLSMDRRVALKVLPQSLTRDERVVERFRREVRMSARLEHPNIVTAFEAGEDFGYHFLAMSYVDGEDLGTRRKREGALEEKEALRAGRQVAEALRYAWEEHKLLHRDVKPSNIMVDSANRARLMDLGISVCLGEAQASLTTVGMVIGTPYYMSPEQIRGEELDWRADAYSLGATLYHLVTGGPPFKGGGSAEVIGQHLTEPVVPARKRRSSVSVGCSQLLERMMAKSREERHRSWDDLLRDFDLVLSGKRPLIAPSRSEHASAAASGAIAAPSAPAPAPPPADTGEERLPPVIKFQPRRQRRSGLRRAIMALVVTLLCAGLGVAGYFLWQRLHDTADSTTEPAPSTASQDDLTEPKELQNVLDAVADALLAQEPKKALDALRQAAQDPAVGTRLQTALGRVETLIGQFRNYNRALRGTFERQIGKQVTLLLRNGKQTVIIDRVLASAVAVSHMDSHGTMRRERIPFRDFSAQERIRRLDRVPGKPASMHLLLGLLYAEVQEYDQARAQFAASPVLLRPAMLRGLDRLIARHLEEVGTRTGP